MCEYYLTKILTIDNIVNIACFVNEHDIKELKERVEQAICSILSEAEAELDNEKEYKSPFKETLLKLKDFNFSYTDPEKVERFKNYCSKYSSELINLRKKKVDKLCEDFIIEIITMDNVVKVAYFADKFDLKNLKECVEQAICSILSEAEAELTNEEENKSSAKEILLKLKDFNFSYTDPEKIERFKNYCSKNSSELITQSKIKMEVNEHFLTGDLQNEAQDSFDDMNLEPEEVKTKKKKMDDDLSRPRDDLKKTKKMTDITNKENLDSLFGFGKK